MGCIQQTMVSLPLPPDFALGLHPEECGGLGQTCRDSGLHPEDWAVTELLLGNLTASLLQESGETLMGRTLSGAAVEEAESPLAGKGWGGARGLTTVIGVVI
ncbi:hypothetical protein H920_01407 [Fukomys damarensis]|uniref:Uncharacterized protein n=1 Tax=Fukomys damarensis TaxID=885580 RepID=A0A091E3V6_FUKDA|nr:hypothetical protein H920_01407 [Fukomys damarensis]